MEDYYVIIGLAPSTLGGDFISVGLVAWAEGKFQFQLSNRKVKIVSELFQTSSKGIRWALDQVAAKLAEENARIANSNSEQSSNSTQYNADFFKYLSRYSNGLLRFSAPKRLPSGAHGMNFEKYFALLIGADSQEILDANRESNQRKYSKEEFKNRIENKLVLPLFESVHTEMKIEGAQFPEIYFPIEVDCIGKNGSVHVAKSFDFENVAFQTSDKHWAHYFVLLSALDRRFPPSNGKSNTYYVIGDEPSIIGSDIHRQWEAIQRTKRVEMVPSESARIVADRILEAKAKKFL